MAKPKIWIMADSPFQSTAYSRIARKFSEFLKDKYEMYYISIQPFGMSFKMNDITFISGSPTQIQHDIGKMHFDHGIYIRNSWIFSQSKDDRVSQLKKLTDDVILYTPVEEDKLPRRFFEGYGKIYDRLWTMTECGKQIIKDMGYEADKLYHFFDMSLRSGKFVSSDKFLSISYSIDYRKGLGMIYPIAEHFHNYDFILTGKSFYYVLTDYKELYPKAKIHYFYEVTNKNDDVVLSDQEIKTLYEEANYYLQTSFKEGFDMTVLEALVNGLITFVPDDTLHRELFNDFPNAVFVKTTASYPGYNQIERMVLMDDWIETIEKNIERKKTGFRLPDRFREETIKKELIKLLEVN